MRALLIAVVAGALASPGALGHGDHQWVQDGGFTAKDGSYCCGPVDCERLDSSEIEIGPGGYRVRGHTIPFEEGQPSQDGEWHQCRNFKCFFVPPGV